MKLRRGSVVLACVLVVAAGAPSLGRARLAAAPASRPNILLLVSDDQAWSDFSRALMPMVYKDLVDQGVLFARAYVNTSLCCPSRSQILTGLYERDTGVDLNTTPLDRPTFPMALHDLGYRTLLAGKYLNSWTSCDPRPEFDQWACVSTPPPSTYSLRDPWINVNGTWRQFSGFQPDILAGQVSTFIQETPPTEPFFAMYTPTSPHLPADDPRYDSMEVAPPRGPSFNANTINARSPQFTRRPPLRQEEIARSDDRYTRMALAVRSLDDAMSTVIDALGDRAQNTIVIYVSDNGFLYGEHRRTGKTDPWEESVRVPTIIRYPPALATSRSFVSHALVENIDIAPTLADLVGIPWGADGTSLMPIVSQQRANVRTAALIQNCRGVNRGSPVCSGLSFYGGQTRTPGFDGVITARYKYVRFDDGSKWLIDLKKDPSELDNLAGSPGAKALQRSLESDLRRLLQQRVDTTIVGGPGDSLGLSGVATFTYFSPSRFSTYRCRLVQEGAPSPPWQDCDGQQAAFGGLSDGTYTFEVVGTNEFGAADPTPATRAFTVHTDGPHMELSQHPPHETTATAVSFAFAPAGGGSASEFMCRLYMVGEPPTIWSPCNSSTGESFMGLADGSWIFDVRGRNGAGPWSDPPAAWVFEVDTTGPSLAFASAPRPITGDRDIAFRFVPTEGILGRVRCALGSRPPVDCSSGTFAAHGLADGPHALTISATDALGNTSHTTYAWSVDLEPPAMTVTGRPGRVSGDTDPTFHFVANTDPAFFLCVLDGRAPMPCSSAVTLGRMKDGSHSMTVWALDVAMNESRPITMHWAIDSIPPGLILSGEPADGAVTSSRTATFSVWQSEPGILYCALDTTEFTECRSPIFFADLADGQHTFQTYVVDRAGNSSIVAARSWTVQATAP